ncbi:protealysin inhibitor emfourin [Kitasatospora sp. NPDC093679]|uniref:protealysin inhibitor emfourin n=1 Tax=Kitasatospora sp. NPDC093679 TaxID=3154983 RepID=UPI00342F677D
MVRVSLERSGGFTGLRTTSSLDTDELAGPEADAALQALEAAGQARKAAGPTAPAALPRYRFTVHAPGGDRTVELTEPQVPPALRPLIAEFKRRQRPAGPPG